MTTSHILKLVTVAGFTIITFGSNNPLFAQETVEKTVEREQVIHKQFSPEARQKIESGEQAREAFQAAHESPIMLFSPKSKMITEERTDELLQKLSKIVNTDTLANIGKAVQGKDVQIDYDVIVGKLKVMGKTDDDIRQIFKDAGLDQTSADCFINRCKSETALTDQERSALIALVSSPIFRDDPALEVSSDVLRGKLKFVGKSKDQIRTELKDAGVSTEATECFIDHCSDSIQLTPDEFSALMIAVSLKRDSKESLGKIGAQAVDQSSARETMILRKLEIREDFIFDVKKFRESHPDLFRPIAGEFYKYADPDRVGMYLEQRPQRTLAQEFVEGIVVKATPLLDAVRKGYEEGVKREKAVQPPESKIKPSDGENKSLF
jgi:hypothetical protein